MTLFGSDAANVLHAMGNSLAIIEFDPMGNILSANGNFCTAMGYQESEIVGRHHRMFVEPDHAGSADYAAFWRRLGGGEFVAGEFKRIGKGGSEIWLQASYNAVRNRRGRVYKVVKFASDVTAARLEAAASSGKLAAVTRAQAVIEFDVDGNILTANDNFLAAMGYALGEISGRHHSMFVDPMDARSAEYAQLWAKLRSGEFVGGEFRRIGKAGKEVWIQASYNPIFDLNGSVVKVVKFATDVTDRVRSVQALGASLESLATGNLQERIDTPFPAALEPLRISFNASVAQLETAIGGVVTSIGSIRTGLSEINTASNDLAQRTEQQAASLEQTVAALGEVTQAVNETADGAGKAQLVAGGARLKAEKGGEVVSRAVEAMSQIERSSAQINRIIGVIDEIAFQTNLLALNAGVEAARAGDAGRGFAVVAQEVRGLAQRSAEAAKEIKTLIATSREQVEAGVELVTASGRSLEEIVTEVSSMAEVISAIAASAREQATNLREVSGAADQMDKVTQQNAAMVEQATAASQTLTNETEELAMAMAKFRTSAGSAGSAGRGHQPAGRGPRPVSRTMTQMKTTGRGGAAPATHAETDSWEEF